MAFKIPGSAGAFARCVTRLAGHPFGREEEERRETAIRKLCLTIPGERIGILSVRLISFHLSPRTGVPRGA
ncbi:MAG TPA: hypothetical protein VLI42_04615 [Chthoniobacterales bacterium]|nr:hypothetical protein [Chthoniobacterales bacterium]